MIVTSLSMEPYYFTKPKRKFSGLLLLCIYSVYISKTVAMDLAHCRNPLGMQSKQIPDNAITASSSYDEGMVGPQNARIRTETNGGAWCPKRHITQQSYEWLQIDLASLTVITMVETQGRFGNGQGREYTRNYLLDYQRDDNGLWLRFRNKTGHEIFKGNENTYLSELSNVDPPIIGKRIRFIPYSNHALTICMRVEMYGCPWTDGTVTYNMPQGDRRGAEVDLFDFSYDGDFSPENYLSGGMGQLTDREIGETNFRLDFQQLGMKGYEWVGWKNNATGNRQIEIIFEFDVVRNFSSVELHCNNLFSKEVRVFKKAVIYFSVGGKYYQSKPVVFKYDRDKVVEAARNVEIHLHSGIGKYIKMVLFFDSKWMMISEVMFHSEPAKGNHTAEVPPPTTSKPEETTGTKDSSGIDDKGFIVEEIPFIPRKSDGEDGQGNDIPESSIPKKGHGSSSDIDSNKYETGDGDIPVSGTKGGDEDSPTTKKKNESSEDDYLGVLISALAAVLVILIIVIVIFIIRQRRKKQNNNRRNTKPVVINLNDRGTNGKVSNGNMYNIVATDEGESDREHCNGGEKYCKPEYCDPKDSLELRDRTLPDLPLTSDSSDVRDYAVPDVTKSALIVNLPPRTNGHHLRSTPPPPAIMGTLDKPPNYDALYAAADVINAHAPNIPSLQGVSGNNVYAVPNAEFFLSLDASVVEFPRDCLRFLEVLGEGQFGEVHLCEAVKINELLTDDFYTSRSNSSRGTLVAVKMLRKDADDMARSDFLKEIKIMSQLKDPNIVRVLGVCTQEEPLCMIVEYMKYGDLNQFILEHVPESPVAQATNAKMLSYGSLIFMASQIASGMKYLESLNMVHRDLATRNCLVGTYYTIKISDFGMSRSLYSADYYRIEGKAVLPIRWMAWESILLGKFTTKSDVWSFAVTLWEVLTFAKDQPFDSLSDEKVIENAGHYYRSDGRQTYLPPPPNCPKEIYDLMRECWNRSETERPSFREIHMFLQRKNMGYNPKDEKLYQIQVPIC